MSVNFKATPVYNKSKTVRPPQVSMYFTLNRGLRQAC